MRWVGILGIWALGVGSSPAQELPATYEKTPDGIRLHAVRLTEPIELDGVLEEPVYRQYQPATEFIQQEPNEGAPASERTEAWVMFDGENLYIAARCFDSQPERMVVNEMRRDSQTIFNNEHFTVSLDPFYDRRSGFFFQTNPLGAIRDQEVGSEVENNNDWNAVWDARAVRDRNGWTFEMMIPFRSLRYRQGGPQIWGILLRRTIRWKNEHVFITPVPASAGFRGSYRFSDAATLLGLEAPPLARNLEMKPYAISSLTTNQAALRPFANDLGADAGVDVKYGLTKGLTLDATYNTDFAQVEDDEQQVNLTRFNLQFPEKREFFLEGRGIFAFGGQQGSGGNASSSLTPVLFFSRRIGLSGAQVVPILAGGRVTGRAGRFAIGALNIQTGEDEDVRAPSTNFSVLRVRRDIFRRSTIGMIATRRDPAFGGGTNELAGVDANLAFYQNLNIRGYWARTWTPGLTRAEGLRHSDASYRAELDYAADRYGLQVEQMSVGREFNPEVGFLRREDFRRTFALARFSPRPSAAFFKAVRKFNYEASLDYITNPEGDLETREAQGTFRTELQNSDVATLEYTRSFEWIPDAFDIATNVRIQPGAYHFQNLLGSYQLGNQHKLAGTFTVARGSFWNGTKTEAGYRGRVELSYRFYMEPGISFNIVRLPAGDFTAKLISTRATFTLTPRIFTSALVQYNSSSNSLSGNYRFRWEYQPGSDLFVVYSDGRDTTVRGYPELVNRTFVVKATRLFRF
jgi:Domain of unknown function (DUF5916)